MKRLLAVLVAGLALCFAGTAQACQPAFSTCSSSAFFNQTVPANQTVDQNSAFYVSKLLAWTNAKNTWINTSAYSVSIFTVPVTQPNVSVRVTSNNGNPAIPALQSSWQQVPIPPTAKPSAGTDSHMVVIQPDTNSMWEFWGGTAPDGLNWHAAWGGTLKPGLNSGMAGSLGYYDWHYTWEQRWAATASTISVLGGLITASDLFSGSIDHELALGIPTAEGGCMAWPAYRTDGATPVPADCWKPNAIPMGSRFYLPATVDISGCSPAIVCMIDRALQKYGAVVRDTTGSSVTFYAEDLSAEGKPDIYGGPNGFIPGYPNNLLAQLPWSQLLVMDEHAGGGLRCCWAL